MARIYNYDSETPDGEENSFVYGVIRFEIIFGAVLLAFGGFTLRSYNDYSVILIGLTLCCLGIIRLWRRYEPQYKSEIGFDQRDRVLGKLERHLDANYTIVTDYQLNEELDVPYLVIGPPGIVLLETLDVRGKVSRDPQRDVWLITDSEDDEKEESGELLDDPIHKNETRILLLRRKLKEEGIESVPIDHRIVLMNHTVEGDPLTNEKVVFLRDIIDSLEQFEHTPLEWKDIDDLERALSLRD